MRGRKPDLKVIEGALDEAPAAPADFPETMRPEWDVIVADLKSRKVLTEAMLGVVENYVRALWTARKAQEALNDHGVLVKSADGTLKVNPAAGLMKSSQIVIARLGAELGLTPASRSKTGMTPPKEDEDDLFSFMDI